MRRGEDGPARGIPAAMKRYRLRPTRLSSAIGLVVGAIVAAILFSRAAGGGGAIPAAMGIVMLAFCAAQLLNLNGVTLPFFNDPAIRGLDVCEQDDEPRSR